MKTIPLALHKELASTSSLVQERLRAGEKPPFAVQALRQTAGRGRRGSPWQSPEGNLYLSLALPWRLSATTAAMVPLYVAYLLGEWLRARAHLRITVKWPNDILFAGRKLAGILCESTAVGGQAGDIVVGIGVNVSTAPVIAEQATIALKDISDFAGSDVKLLGQELVAFFAERWREDEIPQASALVDAYLIETGQALFHAGEKRSAFVGSVADTGALKVVLAAGEEKQLFSADHGWRWIYQEPEAEHASLAVVDLGNSAFKVTRFRAARETDPQETVRGGYDQKSLEALSTLARPAGAQPALLHVASVNPAHTERFSAAAANAGWRVAPIPKRPLRITHSRYDFSRLGIDRLAAMEGAMMRLHKGPQVVVSAGTALTIDVLDADGVHQGGWILAGIMTRLRALKDHTGQLPEVTLESVRGMAHELVQTKALPLGNQTEEALAAGVLVEVQSLIANVCKSAAAAKEPKLWITGGDAVLLEILFPKGVHDPHLIARGLREMVVGGSLVNKPA